MDWKRLVTVICICFVLFVSGCSGKPAETAQQETVVLESGSAVVASTPAPTSPPQPTAGPTQGQTTTPQPQPAEARLMLVGDLMCLSAQIGTARSSDSYDFSGSFAAVQDTFAKADLVCGNLETNVAEGYALPQAGAEGMPVLNAPIQYLDALDYAGFDFVSTINNHSCDLGAEGITETLKNLDDYGIRHTGTFSSPGEPRYVIIDTNGIAVAFVACSEYFNSKDGLLSQEHGYMINRWSPEQMEADIAAAKDAGADFVVVYTHWGIEHDGSANGTQREHAQLIADAGADLIAGSHPHCLQQAEYIGTEDGRSVLCFYSLGNFVSSMAQQIHNDTVIADITLVKDEAATSLRSAAYIPCRVSGLGETAFAVQPVAADSDAAQRIAGAVGDAIPMNTEEG